MHHSNIPFDEDRFKNEMDQFKKSMPSEQATRLNDLMGDRLKEQLGATGNFPDGKLTDTDDGEIKFGITHAEDRVILNFGNPVKWIGFTKEQAKQVAESLVKHSELIAQ